jgi:regulator of sirC expression with transglutaminase-like and TPR domain
VKTGLYILLTTALIVSAYFLTTEITSNPSIEDKTRRFAYPYEYIIAETALEVAKEVFPNMNSQQYHAKLDQMAEELRFQIGTSDDPDFIIRTINTYLFLDEGYCYDNSDFFGRKAKNCFLNGILDTKKGACFTMPLLYLCLAERLGLPIYGVNAPQHFFLRWNDENYRSNIEATGGGGEVPDEQYIRDFHITEGELINGCFMSNMATEQVIGNIYEARGSYYMRKGQTEKAIRDYRKTVELNPKNVEIWSNLSKTYKQQDKTKLAEECREKCRQLGYNFNRSTNEQDLAYIDHFIATAKQQGLDTSKVETLREKARWKRFRQQRQQELAFGRLPRKRPGSYAERYMADWRKKHPLPGRQPNPSPGFPGAIPRPGHSTPTSHPQPHVPTPPQNPYQPRPPQPR